MEPVIAPPGKGASCEDTPHRPEQTLQGLYSEAYLLLCLFFLNLFLRLCVAILCPFFFLPFGIALMI